MTEYNKEDIIFFCKENKFSAKQYINFALSIDKCPPRLIQFVESIKEEIGETND